MVNSDIRKMISEYSDKAVIFEDPAYDNSIIGLSSSGQAVYSIDKMVEELSADNQIPVEEAYDFIYYNTMSILPYINESIRPIVIDTYIDV